MLAQTHQPLGRIKTSRMYCQSVSASGFCFWLRLVSLCVPSLLHMQDKNTWVWYKKVDGHPPPCADTHTTLKRQRVIDNSLAPQEWIASLSWLKSQIENDLCMQNIWIYFLYHNSILLLFLWHSPIECTPPLLDPVEDWRPEIPPQPEQKFQVSRHQKSQLKKGNWKSEKTIMMYFCVLSNRHYSIQDIPMPVFSFSPSNVFLYLSFFPVFEVSSYMGRLVILSFITIILIIFKLCSTVDCVFFGWRRWRCVLFNVRMYHVCGLGLSLGGFPRETAVELKRKKIKFYK